MVPSTLHVQSQRECVSAGFRQGRTCVMYGNTSREPGTVRGTARRPHFSLAFYLRNRSNLDIGVLGYIGVFSFKEHSPEVWHIPPGTSCIYTYIYIVYRVSQEECARLRESVPYVELYRYNPKHLYPKLNGYGDNGQRSLKL